MAETQKPDTRAHTIEYVVTLLSLLALTITLGGMGYRDAMNTAIGAFIGYGMSSRPGGGASGPVVAVSTVGLAFAGNLAGHVLAAGL